MNFKQTKIYNALCIFGIDFAQSGIDFQFLCLLEETFCAQNVYHLPNNLK